MVRLRPTCLEINTLSEGWCFLVEVSRLLGVLRWTSAALLSLEGRGSRCTQSVSTLFSVHKLKLWPRRGRIHGYGPTSTRAAVGCWQGYFCKKYSWLKTPTEDSVNPDILVTVNGKTQMRSDLGTICPKGFYCLEGTVQPAACQR